MKLQDAKTSTNCNKSFATKKKTTLSSTKNLFNLKGFT